MLDMVLLRTGGYEAGGGRLSSVNLRRLGCEETETVPATKRGTDHCSSVCSGVLDMILLRTGGDEAGGERLANVNLKRPGCAWRLGRGGPPLPGIFAN